MSITPSNLLIFFIAVFLPVIFISQLDFYFGSYYNEKRIFQLITLVFTVILLVRRIKALPAILLIPLFFFILSSFTNPNTLGNLSTISIYFLLLAFILITFNVDISLNSISAPIFLIYFIYLTSAFSIFVIDFTLTGNITKESIFEFDNVRFFNQFQFICFIFTSYLFLEQDKGKIFYCSLIFTIILHSFFVSISDGRAVIICTLAFSIFLQFKVKSERTKALLILTFTSIILSYTLVQVLKLYVDLGSDFIRVTSSGRLDIWLEAFASLTGANIIFGQGAGSFFDSQLLRSHPHNSIIQLMIEFGILALLTTLLFIFYHIRSMNQTMRTCTEKIFLGNAIITIFLYSLLSGVIVMPIPQFFSALLIGLYLKHCKVRLYELKGIVHLAFSIGVYSITLISMLALYKSFHCQASFFSGPNIWINGQISFEYCPLLKAGH